MRSRLTGVLLAALCALPVTLSASLPAPTRQWDGWGGLQPPQKAPALGGLDRARETVATVPAWQQIQSLCESDGWDACYMACLQDPGCRETRVDGADVFVTEIADPLGNRPALTQASASAQPKLVAGAFGGLDGVMGDGVGTGMATATFDAKGHPFTVIVLARSDAASGNRYVVSAGPTGGSALGFLINQVTSGAQMAIHAGSSLTATSAEPPQQDFVLVGHYDGASSHVRINGAETAGDTGSLDHLDLRLLFRGWDSVERYWHGPSAAFVYRTGAYNASAVEAMECLLASLSEITVAGCD